MYLSMMKNICSLNKQYKFYVKPLKLINYNPYMEKCTDKSTNHLERKIKNG